MSARPPGGGGRPSQTEAAGRPPLRRRLPALAALIAVGLFLAVGLTQIALTEQSESGGQVELTGRQQVAQLYRGLRQDGASLGPAGAQLQLDVFVDLQCQPCTRWYVRTVPALIRERVIGGNARVKLRHVSVSDRERTLAALATIAAARQDEGWTYADLLARNLGQVDAQLDASFLRAVARAVGLDMRRWEAERDAASASATIVADTRAAAELRLPAEPAIVVTGPGGARTLVRSPTRRDVERAARAVGS